jgi:hypothetical protein
MIVASIALVDMDAGLDPVSRSRSVMTGPSVWLSTDCRARPWHSTNWPPPGWVNGVAIDKLQRRCALGRPFCTPRKRSRLETLPYRGLGRVPRAFQASPTFRALEAPASNRWSAAARTTSCVQACHQAYGYCKGGSPNRALLAQIVHNSSVVITRGYGCPDARARSAPTQQSLEAGRT